MTNKLLAEIDWLVVLLSQVPWVFLLFNLDCSLICEVFNNPLARTAYGLVWATWCDGELETVLKGLTNKLLAEIDWLVVLFSEVA